MTDDQKAQIVARRPGSIQVANEATDDIIVAPALDEKTQHMAGFLMTKKNFTGFEEQ